jgi:DNA-directed RNA polymerase specialized sigma24 family protein
MNNDERREPEGSFEDFFARAEPRLRAALTSLYGADMGREATAEAMAWAYEHWERVRGLDHRVAYLYRVGQSRTRRLRRPRRTMFTGTSGAAIPDVDPRLAGALAALPDRQRVAVTLVHGHDWSHADVATVMGVTPSTVSTHVARALAQLRVALEVAVNDRD